MAALDSPKPGPGDAARESSLLAHIFSMTAGSRGAVLVGPGDDCAVVASPGGPLLVTVDHLVEGRHFRGPLGTGTSVDLVARKAMARSVSDLAAMAGAPAWSLATAAVPPEFAQATGEALVQALVRWGQHWGCPLAGGDLSVTTAGAPVVLTVTVGGATHSSRGPVLRSGAKPGDGVWITGRVGASLASGRHLTFEPRVREAAALAGALGTQLRAMIDVSDGVGRDAGRLALASGARIELEADRIPLNDSNADPQIAAGEGEDYELVFTAPAEAAVPGTVEGTTVTRIGRVVAGAGCVIIGRDGRVHDAAELGWDH